MGCVVLLVKKVGRISPRRESAQVIVEEVDGWISALGSE